MIIVSRSRETWMPPTPHWRREGVAATAFVADLSDGAAAERIVADSERQVGPIAVLVNSAGGARRVPPNELSPDKWRAAMDAKFFTYMNVMDRVLPRMAPRGAGAIVNIVGTGEDRFADPSSREARPTRP